MSITIQNNMYQTLGYINGDQIQNNMYQTIAYVSEQREMKTIAALFFFFNLFSS